MIVRPLTSVEVKSAKAQGKDFSLHDGFGLLLYITSRGGKSWRFRYVHPVTKKRQTYTIGRYWRWAKAQQHAVLPRETIRADAWHR
ncbi:integrase arm-type DNA-binding domain-containing protein [Escherichia coli]|uniref:integrase arm-type DNA-binding domain-containing protein n=1 Tax=Escherichia coli TaxID=562 RepID=UPI0024127663|nr:integrase arm-type DNA-binding domain-containing protein [Escherichia coli]